MEKHFRVYIKGMVCDRCISTVKEQLHEIGVVPVAINLGIVVLSPSTEMPDLILIEEKLRPLGFELLKNKKSLLINGLKALVTEVYSGDFDFPAHFRFSDLAVQRLHRDYYSLSATFSVSEHITLEKYIIAFRIEKIKESLVASHQTLADISFRLGFSSVPHLSRHFKMVTGLTPSSFKLLNTGQNRINAPEV